MRCWLICLFIELCVCLRCESQVVFTVPSEKQHLSYDSSQINAIPPAPPDIRININRFCNTVKTVPPTFYYNSIGFFCKKELQLEKTLKFPVKFRLGSVAYTDEMEGKGNRNAITRK